MRSCYAINVVSLRKRIGQGGSPSIEFKRLNVVAEPRLGAVIIPPSTDGGELVGIFVPRLDIKQ